MTYALYVDPSRKTVPVSLPPHAPQVAYWRLIDCTPEQLRHFDPDALPRAEYTIAEIHPEQLDALPCAVDRLSIVQQRSAFADLSRLRELVSSDTRLDITFMWDRRFSVDYYIRLLRYWVQWGVQHLSFYELSDFEKWRRLVSVLQDYGFVFYDRYHACLPGFESPYQKYITTFGDLYALGGWSRVTGEDGVTRFREPNKRDWEILAPNDQLAERLLFALADRQGIALADLEKQVAADNIRTACASGLAMIENGRLIPTDYGLWDTVGLVARLHPD